MYRKFPKYSDTQKICCNHSKIWNMWLYHRVTSPNDADGMANSVDPDQTAPLAVWSGSALFAQAYLSENLGSLRYKALNRQRFGAALTWRIFKPHVNEGRFVCLINMTRQNTRHKSLIHAQALEVWSLNALKCCYLGKLTSGMNA